MERVESALIIPHFKINKHIFHAVKDSRKCKQTGAKIPVEAQAACQHSPVTATRAGGIQTGTNFLSDGDGKSKSIWTHLR